MALFVYNPMSSQTTS